MAREMKPAKFSELSPGTSYYEVEGMSFRGFFIGPDSGGGYRYMYSAADGGMGGEAHTFEDKVVFLEVRDDA